MNPEALRREIGRDLLDEFLPVMEAGAIDDRYGGFLCTGEEKDSWHTGRGAWVYAFLYRHFTGEARHLEIARRAVEFALRVRPKGDPRWPRKFTRSGEALTADSEIYGALFMAEGIAEYGAAAGLPEYLALAEQIVRECLALYDRPGYQPDTCPYLGPGAPEFPGARVQGVPMLLMRLATRMGLDDLAARAVDDLTARFWNAARGLNYELLNEDYSPSSGPYGSLFYTGHALEAMWMVMDEARRIGDGALFDLAASRFRRHVNASWDVGAGGFVAGLFDGKPIGGKPLWAQEEVMVGALMMGDLGLFGRAYDWTRANLPWRSAYPGRIENYHHPRWLMLSLMELKRMEP